MAHVLEIFPHATGPWLVRSGNRTYAVPPDLGRAMRPLAGKRPAPGEVRSCLADAVSLEEMSGGEMECWIGKLTGILASEGTGKKKVRPGGRTGRSIRFRIPLLPASVVGRLAFPLKPLTGTPGLVFLAVAGTAGYLYGTAGSGWIGFSWDLGTVVAGLGLFLGTALWHEIGHATALARSGYPPGGIGAGLLFVIPVLFADVTAVGVLKRRDRLRVDTAGAVFQLAFGGLLVCLGGLPFVPRFWCGALTLAGSSAFLAVGWSMFPFIRSDGYWLLCDLLGLVDLDRPPPWPVPKGLRIFLVAYQLVNAGFLVLIGLYFPWKLMKMAAALFHRLGFIPDAPATTWVAPALTLAFLAMMAPGLVRRISQLVRSAITVSRSRLPAS